MLVGQELLDKARALSNRREDEIARGCGYVGPSGRVLKKSFYRALVEAKGYTLPSASNSGGGPRGRQAEFRTRVHGNGNLLIGHAYTRRLGLEPGQEFRSCTKTQGSGCYPSTTPNQTQPTRPDSVIRIALCHRRWIAVVMNG